MSDAKKTSGKAAVEELSDALDAAVDAAMKQANDAQKAVDVGSFSLELSAPLSGRAAPMRSWCSNGTR